VNPSRFPTVKAGTSFVSASTATHVHTSPSVGWFPSPSAVVSPLGQRRGLHELYTNRHGTSGCIHHTRRNLVISIIPRRISPDCFAPIFRMMMAVARQHPSKTALLMRITRSLSGSTSRTTRRPQPWPWFPRSAILEIRMRTRVKRSHRKYSPHVKWLVGPRRACPFRSGQYWPSPNNQVHPFQQQIWNPALVPGC
jgi:hypothetical protein